MPEGMSVLAEGQFDRRVRECLEIESVISLTAVGADGTPQPNPVWFFGQQEGFLICNRSGANRLAHIARRPKVSLDFDGDGRGVTSSSSPVMREGWRGSLRCTNYPLIETSRRSDDPRRGQCGEFQ
jgi:hypothetical protein